MFQYDVTVGITRSEVFFSLLFYLRFTTSNMKKKGRQPHFSIPFLLLYTVFILVATLFCCFNQNIQPLTFLCAFPMFAHLWMLIVIKQRRRLLHMYSALNVQLTHCAGNTRSIGAWPNVSLGQKAQRSSSTGGKHPS